MGRTIDDTRAPSTLETLGKQADWLPPHADYRPPESALCRACPFGGLRSSVIPDAEAHVWRADGWSRLGQAGSSKRIWSPATSVGGASPTRCSGGARAGWASGMSVGNPRCPRKRTITTGSSIEDAVRLPVETGARHPKQRAGDHARRRSRGDGHRGRVRLIGAPAWAL